MHPPGWLLALIVAAVFVASGNTLAADINDERAKFHYQLHCQGCHTEDGRGYLTVPGLQGFVGNFLKIDEGRAYLVRVPGSANAYLSDEHLAELLNWMLLQFAGGSLPNQWRPYSGTEVADYRSRPLLEVDNYRKSLVSEIDRLSSMKK